MISYGIFPFRPNEGISFPRTPFSIHNHYVVISINCSTHCSFKVIKNFLLIMDIKVIIMNDFMEYSTYQLFFTIFFHRQCDFILYSYYHWIYILHLYHWAVFWLVLLFISFKFRFYSENDPYPFINQLIIIFSLLFQYYLIICIQPL